MKKGDESQLAIDDFSAWLKWYTLQKFIFYELLRVSWKKSSPILLTTAKATYNLLVPKIKVFLDAEKVKKLLSLQSFFAEKIQSLKIPNSEHEASELPNLEQLDFSF